MRNPIGPYRVAMEAALRGSAALATALGGTVRLYGTAAPTNAPLPYIVVTYLQATDLFDGLCAAEPTLHATLDFWSRPSPPDKGATSAAIGDAIVTALDVALTLDGWEVVEHECLSLGDRQDPDQSIHGTVELEYQLSEIVA